MGEDGDKHHPLAGRWAPNLTLHVEGKRTCVADLMRAGRGVLLDLAGRPALRDTVTKWAGRVDAVSARCYERPVNLDAMLIRPDGYVAWALTSNDGEKEAASTLSAALKKWFGASR